MEADSHLDSKTLRILFTKWNWEPQTLQKCSFFFI